MSEHDKFDTTVIAVVALARRMIHALHGVGICTWLSSSALANLFRVARRGIEALLNNSKSTAAACETTQPAYRSHLAHRLAREGYL
jgi:hypothetical protein